MHVFPATSRFLYQAGAIDRGKGEVLDMKLLEEEQRRRLKLPAGQPDAVSDAL